MRGVATVAKRALAHARLLRKRHIRSPYEPLFPSEPHLRTVIEALFWASIMSEEGRFGTPSVVWAPPGKCPDGLRFRTSLPLTPSEIAKLAPIASGLPTPLGVVARKGRRPEIWGVAPDTLWSIRVRAIRPGDVSIDYGFHRLALFSQQRCLFLGAGMPQCAAMLAAGFAPTLPDTPRTVLAVLLLQIVKRVREAGGGGTILVVPAANGDWPSALEAQRYPLEPPALGLARKFKELVDPIDKAVRQKNASRTPGMPQVDAWSLLPGIADINHYVVGEDIFVDPELQQAVNAVAGLAAVDGAVVLDDALRVLSCGARIGASVDGQLPRALQWIPVDHGDGPKPRPVDAVKLGGTRHQSAFRFVSSNRESVALVASHDGPVSAFVWLKDKQAVLAVRNIDYLF